MKKSLHLPFILVFLVGLICNGCGYTTGAVITSRFKSIHIESFVNNIDYGSKDARRIIYIPLLENDVTVAIINRFQFDGHFKIARKEVADVILQGQLLKYERHVLRYTDNFDVEEFRANVIVALTLWDPAKEEAVWTETYFVGETTYFETGALAKSEEVAVQAAVDDLARRIVERTIEDW